MPRRRAVRSLPDDDVITARILEALHKKSPRRPAELIAAAKAEKHVVRGRIKQLAADGKVTVTGATVSRLVYLGKPNGTAGPVSSKPVKSAAPVKQRSENTRADTALDQVEVLDEALLANLKVAGRVGRSVGELKMIRPEESPEAIERSLTRLRIKKRVAVDHAGRWTVV